MVIFWILFAVSWIGSVVVGSGWMIAQFQKIASGSNLYTFKYHIGTIILWTILHLFTGPLGMICSFFTCDCRSNWTFKFPKKEKN